MGTVALSGMSARIGREERRANENSVARIKDGKVFTKASAPQALAACGLPHCS
ncbi:MAG: hypothetical protein QF473_35450 [Planctomycetota bacterium]|jgi:hypothetical protein|nr:hypothetical protein [Planctomycetota bacterium]